MSRMALHVRRPGQLNDFVGRRIISKELWPPISPDLTALWDFLKKNEYRTSERKLARMSLEMWSTGLMGVFGRYL